VKILVVATVILMVAELAPVARAAVIGQVDTFQDGTTDGWFAGGLGMGQIPPNPPHVVPSGGPAGVGDQYLVITSQGGTGAGSRLVAINGAQWAGDYLAAGISFISADLKNLGTTDLTIRLLFEDPMGGPPVDEAVTTFGAFLPVGSDWTHVVFAITPGDLTVVTGSVTAVLSNTTLLRIIDSPTPGDAVTIAGVLGVDNIAAVPEPSAVLLVGCGLALIAFRRLRRYRHSHVR
jgi:hypothetical protein